MGFKKDAYATIWEVKTFRESMTKVNLSVSVKNRETDAYVTSFSHTCTFFGAAAVAALNLQRLDRIKLGDVDVTNKYDREKNTTYWNCNVYSFEMADEKHGGKKTESPKPSVKTSRDDPEPETPDPDDNFSSDDELPF
jgi:hypothetical protein